MIDGRSKSDGLTERVDADAVCGKCGSVNPEDTLLCKTCGNNLRDQRMRRVSGQQVIDLSTFRPEGAQWVGKLVVVFGLLLIVWVAINIEKIEEFMAGAQISALSNAEQYWRGPDRRIFEQLAADLKAHPVTDVEAEAGLKQPLLSDTFPGRYTLTRRGAAQHTPFGQAIVQVDGEVIRFVAVLSNGDVEMRGEARIEGNTRIAARDSAGVRIRTAYYGATGFAQRLEGGGYECLGLCDLNDETYGALAFRVP